MSTEAAALPLQHRVLRAGAWALMQHSAALFLRLGGNLILTRLLAPEAFGLVAVVQAFIVALALLSDAGLAQSLVVHRRGDDAELLNTAWTVSILRGIVIWVATVCCALAVAFMAQIGWFGPGSVYTDPQLPTIMIVFGLSALISGFESTRVLQARRRMQFKQITIIELASQAVALVVMLIVASTFRTVWALVAGAIIATVMKVVASHYLLPGHANRIGWDQSAWRDIFGLGKWIFLSSSIGALVVSGDRLFLGAMVDPFMLGLYSIAMLLLGVVQATFGAVVSSILLPALSEVVRDRPQDTRRVYARFQLQVDIVLFGAAGFLHMAGPAIAHLLYDERYSGVGTMLAVLALGLIGERHVVAGHGFVAMGQASYQAAANFCRLAALCIFLPLGFALFGISGAIVAIVASPFAGWPVALYFERRNGLFDLRRLILGVPLFAAGAAMGWAGSIVLRGIPMLWQQ